MGKQQGNILSVCDYCGKENTISVSVYNLHKRHFCNRKCFASFLKEKLPKQEHPAYGKGLPTEEVQKRKKAVRDVEHAVRDRRLFKKPCEVCGEEKVHGHHDNYNEPLKVRWLCFKHHMEVHGRKVAV